MIALDPRSTLARRAPAVNARIWRRLPGFLRTIPPVRSYGRHVHASVRRRAARQQSFGTFFLRNRPELELMRRLADRRPQRSTLDVTVLACSKGAEVYSIAWAVRSARPDLELRIHAVDIAADVLEFARNGRYSLESPDGSSGAPDGPGVDRASLAWNTCRDQIASVFARMTDPEMASMFDRADDHVAVKKWLTEGITWHCADAGDPELVGVLGLADMVVANRFLCHMEPAAAGRCLRAIARIVKPGGYLFVSGVDLDVRTDVARQMRWTPVTDLIREIHEGDASLRAGWPLQYWGLEPLDDDRPDWTLRYASVFRLGITLDDGKGC